MCHPGRHLGLMSGADYFLPGSLRDTHRTQPLTCSPHFPGSPRPPRRGTAMGAAVMTDRLWSLGRQESSLSNKVTWKHNGTVFSLCVCLTCPPIPAAPLPTPVWCPQQKSQESSDLGWLGTCWWHLRWSQAPLGPVGAALLRKGPQWAGRSRAGARCPSSGHSNLSLP